MASRSRSRNSSLSLVKNIGARARRKLTNTKSTAEPDDIVQSKVILKSTKNFTTDIEQSANMLYLSQIEQAKILRTLSNKLTNIPVHDSGDHFSIFLNKMGRAYQNMQNIYEMHLVNMKDELVNPLKEFNRNEIEQCQVSKLQLKTIKAQYDVQKQNEDKIKKMLDERFPTDPPVNNSKKKRSKSHADLKSIELELARIDFIKSVITMNGKKMQLMQSMKHYMSSFEAYSVMNCQNININIKNQKVEHKMMENISVVVKEGYFKKNGKRKYFKLFTNKKLVYMTGDGPNGVIKGYIDLNKIFDINKNGKDLIEIQTVAKMYVFRFDNLTNVRDEWFAIIQDTVAHKTVTILQTKKSFEESLYSVDTMSNDIVSDDKYIEQYLSMDMV